MTSWLVWARGVGGLTASQSLVLFELARLADARGVVICAVEYLVECTGVSRRSVFRSLAGLESRGVLSRQMRYVRGRKAASRFVLHWMAGVSDSPVQGELCPGQDGCESDACEGVVPLSMSDNEGLRRVVLEAASEGWVGTAAQCLAVTVQEVGARQFSNAISRGVQFSRMSWSESVADTCGIAWEVLMTCASQVVEASRPWAMWTTIVNRRCFARDKCAGVEEAVEPSMMPEAGLRPGQGDTGDAWVCVDDFEGPLARMVTALIEAGMTETLAWAGTRRIAELAVGDSSRRHRMASVDPRLGDLGVGGEAARAWMTMLVGSRRGVKGSLLQADDEALAIAAREVVEALNLAA